MGICNESGRKKNPLNQITNTSNYSNNKTETSENNTLSSNQKRDKNKSYLNPKMLFSK